jgi:hypothetical protein
VTPSTTSVVSSANPTTVGDPVTYAATVTGGSGTPTGGVNFTDGGVTICTAVPLDTNGNATCAQTYPSTGGSPHAIAVDYSGDSTYAASSGSLSPAETVNRAAPTVTLSSLPNPAGVGQQVTYTANVSGPGVQPAGLVDFKDGATTVGNCTAATVVLASGGATCSVTYNSTLGSPHNVTASYSGDTNYMAATSNTDGQTVVAATSSTLLSSSANPSAAGQPVTFSAAVTGSFGTPTGSVDFADGGSLICSAVGLDSNGHGQCGHTYTSTAGSPHHVTAVYSGDHTYSGSTANAVDQTVNPGGTVVALNSSANPVSAGQPVSYNATVTGPGVMPTGTMTFQDGGVIISGCGSRPLIGAVATCTHTYTSVGSHSITSVYAGDANHTGSSAGPFRESVLAAPVRTVARIAGNGQRATVGTHFSVALGVHLTDQFDNPVAGVLVVFSTTEASNGATGLYPNNSSTALTATDANGNATIGIKANFQSGSYAAKASVAGFPTVTYALTNTPGGPGTVTITGGNQQSAVVTHGYGVPLAVRVTDGFSNPVPGTRVTLQAPSSGASGTFPNGTNSITLLTDNNGAAGITLVANGTSGSFAVSATAATGVGNAFLETNVAIAPGSPSFVSASASGNLVTVVWGPPSYDGGSPVTSYAITLLPSGTVIPVNSGLARSFQFVFFANGANLSVTVAATNVAGTGPPSARATVFVVRPGYWLVARDGGIFSFGSIGFWGSTGRFPLNRPIVGMGATISGNGYWLVASDGGIFSFGDARFFGSTGSMHLNRPIVGMAVTPTGRGYWLVASDGGIFSFGDARFFGSTGSMHLNRPIVGMAASPSGNGYWMVASDGGIFAFGDARFHGSTGGMVLNRPIVAMAPTPGGTGYWLVASDGGVFSFGDAQFHGSAGNIHLNSPIVGMTLSPTGRGYWMVASDGGMFSFGDAQFYGSEGGNRLNQPIVAVGTQPISHL